jgi:hypothetical protein
MPRPTKKMEYKHSKKITVKLTESEYADLENKAQKTGFPLATLVRISAINGTIHERKIASVDPAIVRALSLLISELSRQGGLLKQFFTSTGGEHRDKTATLLETFSVLSAQGIKLLEKIDSWGAG